MRQIAIVVGVFAAAVVAAIVAARAMLPNTSCSVAEAQWAALQLETMSYSDVKAALGCDGVLASKQDLGEITIEIYQWRGDAWPFGRFEGQFINDKLHGSSKLWLNLKAEQTKSQP